MCTTARKELLENYGGSHREGQIEHSIAPRKAGRAKTLDPSPRVYGKEVDWRALQQAENGCGRSAESGETEGFGGGPNIYVDGATPWRLLAAAAEGADELLALLAKRYVPAGG